MAAEVDNLSKLLKLFDKIPAIKRIGRDVEQRQRKARITFHRFDSTSAEMQGLIKENGFSKILLYKKEE